MNGTLGLFMLFLLACLGLATYRDTHLPPAPIAVPGCAPPPMGPPAYDMSEGSYRVRLDRPGAERK